MPFRTQMIPEDRVIGELTFDFIRAPGRRVTFTSLLLEATDAVIVTAHVSSPSKPVVHRDQVVLDRGFMGVWFVFKDRPFDVARVYQPDGTWTGYYVDVLEPVRWEGSEPRTLQPIIDLFLDLWIAPDGTYTILDEDEFREASSRGHPAEEQVRHAQAVLRELIEATRRGEFPPAMVRGYRW